MRGLGSHVYGAQSYIAGLKYSFDARDQPGSALSDKIEYGDGAWLLNCQNVDVARGLNKEIAGNPWEQNPAIALAKSGRDFPRQIDMPKFNCPLSFTSPHSPPHRPPPGSCLTGGRGRRACSAARLPPTHGGGGGLWWTPENLRFPEKNRLSFWPQTHFLVHLQGLRRTFWSISL
jgi:hypothetical protein